MKFLVRVVALAGAARAALDVDLESPDSIRSAARRVVDEMMGRWYAGNQTGKIPGIINDGRYFWWQGGALWGTLIDYWYYTRDPSYNQVISQAILFQADPPNNSFQHRNWTLSLGNDDQGFWGMTAMLAAENNFPDPPPGQPQWLTLALGVHNTQASPERWDGVCGGGIRWQIPVTNPGYDYKNTIANGIFANMAARLARYTNNETYLSYVESTWDFMADHKYFSPSWDVYDGASDVDNCTLVRTAQFAYNAAVTLQAAAVMYNHTQSAKWKARVDGLVNRTLEYFFVDGILIEHSCELPVPKPLQCTEDMLSYKGFLLRWLAQSAQLVPYHKPAIKNAIKTTMQHAIKNCQGNVCSFRWTEGVFEPEHSNAMENMNMVAGLSVLLMDEPHVRGPLSNSTGATSVGDPTAGITPSFEKVWEPITTAHRAGASILTVMIIAGIISAVVWVSGTYNEHGAQQSSHVLQKRLLLTSKA